MDTLEPPNHNRDDDLQEFVAECIEALGRGGDTELGRCLARRPDLAPGARAQLEALRRMGILEERRTPAASAVAKESIGPYRVLEPLGEGGMGTVYLAEQREPVRRLVALKVIRRGMDSRDVVTRFAAERQALAMMNHANVARVLDAGEAADGRPYFVMEFVAGVPITTYADRQRLDTKQRIELFLQVCEGVQHAHGKALIHRDLKPSNVLVAELDGHAVPKIIDFGVAKAIGQRLTDATLHTMHGMVIGTPEYMSPEQAGRDALDIDIRSDVYSLGVLLYELLTGVLPLASDRLRTDFVEMQRVLREEEPRTPSQQVTVTPETAARAAAQRSTSVVGLRKQLRGDLDWICLRALEKNRDRRYPTVHDLAADLRRHLAHEPVLAGPPSTLYRLAKFVRRNRLAVTAGSAVLASLVAGLVVAWQFYRQAEASAQATAKALLAQTAARREADAAATAAQQALAKETTALKDAEQTSERTFEVIDRLLLRILDKRLSGVPQMELVRRDLLAEAKALCEFLLTQRDQARARFEAARVQIAVARLEEELGNPTGALRSAQEAVAALGELAARHPDDAGIAGQVGLALRAKATAQRDLGDLVAARQGLGEAIEAFRSAALRHRQERGLQDALVMTIHDRANLLVDVDLDAAITDFRDVAAQLDTAIAARPQAAHLLDFRARVRASLAGALRQAGRIPEAEGELRSALEYLETQEDNPDTETRHALAQARVHLAAVLFTSGKPNEAEPYATAAARSFQRLVDEQPLVPAHRLGLATCHTLVGSVRSDLGHDETLTAFRAAVATLVELTKRHPDTARYRRVLASYAMNFAIAAYASGDRATFAEGELEARRAEQILQSELARTPGDSVLRRQIAAARLHVAQLRLARGECHEACAMAQSAVDELAALAEAGADRVNQLDALITLLDATICLGEAQLGAGRLDAARATLQRGHTASASARALVDGPSRFDQFHVNLKRLQGVLDAWTGNYAAAAQAAHELLDEHSDNTLVRLAAADLWRCAWRGAPSTEATRSNYLARAKQTYTALIERLEANLEREPDDDTWTILLARAQLGLCEVELALDPAADVEPRLRSNLTTLQHEMTVANYDLVLARQVRFGAVTLADAALRRGDLTAAAAAAQGLAQAAQDAEMWLDAAKLHARCATASTTGDQREQRLVDALAALRAGVARGLTADEIRASSEFAAWIDTPRWRALLQSAPR